MEKDKPGLPGTTQATAYAVGPQLSRALGRSLFSQFDSAPNDHQRLIDEVIKSFLRGLVPEDMT